MLGIWLLATSPLFVLAVVNGRTERQLLLRDAMSDIRLLARITAEEHRALVRETRQILVVLSQTEAVRKGDAAACERTFRGILEADARYANIGALRPDGDLFASGIPLTEPASAADRAFYRRALESGRFSVGEFHIGEVSRRPVVAFALPVAHDDGRLSCILYAAVDLQHLGTLAQPGGLPEGSSITVFDASGTILIRHPDPEMWIGKEIADQPFYVAARRATDAGVAEETGLDGVRRLYAFSSLIGVSDGEQVILALGVPLESITAEASRVERRNIVVLLIVTVIGAAASFLVGDRWIVRLFGHVYDLSIQDPLTHAYNRRFLYDFGRAICAQAKRSGEPVSAVQLDIDHFKKVNDSKGHSVGDEVLREVARRLRETIRAGDIVARSGGEEFCALLPETGIEEAAGIAERLRAALAGEPAHTSGGLVQVTLSAGVATLHPGQGNFETLLKEADLELYRSKNEGRNRVSSRRWPAR
ncbi:MAG: GGDEF domain-containing protein [Planctomycetes bacterium]|nr:GGDEF domain-containing protein [Planctomycetota bacterium]